MAAAQSPALARTEGGRRKGDGVRGERRLRGDLEDLAASPVGPQPGYGRHRMPTRRSRSKAGRQFPPSSV
jgi:hypothetical protein